jgi:hypothetical protein
MLGSAKVPLYTYGCGKTTKVSPIYETGALLKR